MSQLPTVILVEDSPLILVGLQISLERLNCCTIVNAVSDGEQAILESHKLRPDVILMDVGLPGIDGVEATWRIKQALPRTRVIMFTSHTKPDDVTAALGAGADGYCSKDTSVDQIALAIDSVMRGDVWLDPAIAEVIASLGDTLSGDGIELSETELRILGMIKEQVENREIARRLNISSEKVARVMQRLIQQFMDKRESHTNTADDTKVSHEWLMPFVEHLKDGKIIAGKYSVESLIGTGGIGAVFKAKHLYMDRYVALKLLHPEFAEDRLVMRNFQREATAIAKLKHDNIVGIYDFGMSEDNLPYLVMEYVEGTDLGVILSQEIRLASPRAVDICIQVCEGLAEAHKNGIAHCDLKPSNILIQGLDPNELVKVVDFGLAEIIPREHHLKPETTQRLFITGTPSYMSPEQCLGKQLNTLSDVYSLGCILYESLTGINPFRSDTAMETFTKHISLIPPAMSESYPAVFSPQLENCVARMLAKDPTVRPQSMEEVIKILRLLTDASLEEEPMNAALNS